MADLAVRRATAEDLQHAPPHSIAELVDGVVHVQPRPAGPHALAGSVLSEELGPPFRRGRGGPGGWVLLFEPELHLDGDVLVPDLAGWRVGRAPSLRSVAFEVAPDWVCEILTPASIKWDRLTKSEAYARHGVEWLWLVDPATELLEAYTLREQRWLRLGGWSGDDVARIPSFDAIELELAPLWVREEDARKG
ncbi:MAG: Uma2 family endonuclease [Polyangiaceae bacterium]|nr:Uma2 family endonuclease [Polyangiaceae bacterium]